MSESAYKYSVLKQTNPCYAAKQMEQVNDLYVGGFAIQAKAEQYLPRLAFERGNRYQERCATASYINFFAQIVDQFVADVATQPLSIIPAPKNDKEVVGETKNTDFWAAFEKDADLCGNSIESVLTDQLRTGLMYDRAIIAIDCPKLEEAEDKSFKLDKKVGNDRIYTYEVPIESVIDWKLDQFGEYEWIILYDKSSERTSIGADRSMCTETWTIWSMDGDVAVWAKYAIEHREDEKVDDNKLIPLVEEGESTFKRIPFVLMDVPEGLRVGNKLAGMATEYWQRRSALIGAQNRSMVAIPYVKLGPEMSAIGQALPSEVQQDSGRGQDPVQQFQAKGFFVIGKDDTLGYAEPDGKCYTIVTDELKELRDMMFSVTHQMAASIKPTGAALGRSGLSKQKDEDKTAKVLAELGKLVRSAGIKIYTIISEALGEDAKWQAHGMQNFEKIDKEQLTDELAQMPLLLESIGAPTFSKMYKMSKVRELLTNIDPETMDQIQKEVDDAVDQQAEHHDAEQELDLAAKEQAAKPKPAPIVNAPTRKS